MDEMLSHGNMIDMAGSQVSLLGFFLNEIGLHLLVVVEILLLYASDFLADMQARSVFLFYVYLYMPVL